MADFFWFSDEQWSRIEPLLPCDTRGMTAFAPSKVTASTLVPVPAEIVSAPVKFAEATLTVRLPVIDEAVTVSVPDERVTVCSTLQPFP